MSRRKSSAYAFSHSEGFGRMIHRGEYLQDPNEFRSSRVLTGGRSLSRRLPTVAQEDTSETISTRKSLISHPKNSVLNSDLSSQKARSTANRRSQCDTETRDASPSNETAASSSDRTAEDGSKSQF